MIYRNRERVSPWLPIAAVIATFVGLLIAGTADHEAEVLEMRQYCAMVERWESSGGEIGWPPYRPEIKCEDTTDD